MTTAVKVSFAPTGASALLQLTKESIHLEVPTEATADPAWLPTPRMLSFCHAETELLQLSQPCLVAFQSQEGGTLTGDAARWL